MNNGQQDFHSFKFVDMTTVYVTIHISPVTTIIRSANTLKPDMKVPR